MPPRYWVIFFQSFKSRFTAPGTRVKKFVFHPDFSEKRSAENPVFMGFFTMGENDMKEDCEFFGIRKNPDPDHVPKIKYEQIMSRSDAELLAWICSRIR